MLKAKTKMIERDSEAFASEVFAVADKYYTDCYC